MTKKWKFDPFASYSGVKWLKDRTIFMTVHGSCAYGTNTPESDIDLRGIAIPPTSYLHGFLKNFDQAISNEPYDMVVYGLQKFMKLAADCNPNIIEILHTSPEDWLVTSPIFTKLWNHRHDFLSKRARYSFAGYAYGQLKRIKSHRHWLLNPPKNKPTRKEYGLLEERRLNHSETGAVSVMVEKNVHVDENIMAMFQREQKYQSAKREWKQYQSWLASRNKDRAKLEAKFGYDCKHAMHLVRLMRLCKEILETGEVLVKRPDAKELKKIRNGAWTYDQLIDWATAQESKIEEALKVSSLPKEPDRNMLDDLCVSLVEEALKSPSVLGRTFKG